MNCCWPTGDVIDPEQLKLDLDALQSFMFASKSIVTDGAAEVAPATTSVTVTDSAEAGSAAGFLRRAAPEPAGTTMVNATSAVAGGVGDAPGTVDPPPPPQPAAIATNAMAARYR